MPKVTTYPKATSLGNTDEALVLQGGLVKFAPKSLFVDDGVIYKHPRGDAEYAGSTLYATSGTVFGVGVSQKILAPVVVKYIDVRMWGSSATACEVKVYKSTQKHTSSQDMSQLTLVETFTYLAGQFNTNSDAFLSLILTEELTIYQNEYLWILCNPSAGNAYIKRWSTQSAEEPYRDTLVYTLTDDFTSNWTVGGVNYYGAPVQLRRAVGVVLSVVQDLVAAAKAETIAVTQAILNPRMTIPATVYACVGIEFNIFSDALVLGTDCGKTSPKEYSVEYISTVGKSHERGFKFLPVVGDVGTKSLKINVYDSNHTIVQTKTVSLVVIAATAPASVKNVSVRGDSLTANGTLVPALQQNFADLTDNIPLFWGTIGTDPAKHEGRSGWTFGNFATAGSPLWNTALDIANYRNTLSMGAEKFHVVSYELGINESFGVVKTEADRLAVIASIKALIDADIADNATTKIIIQLPTTDGNTKGGWAENYGSAGYKSEYQQNVWRLRELIISNFDAGAYHANVFVGIAGLGLDRYYGYTRISQLVCSRLEDTEEVHTNAVHPSTAGFPMLSDAIFPLMLHLLS